MAKLNQAGDRVGQLVRLYTFAVVLVLLAACSAPQNDPQQASSNDAQPEDSVRLELEIGASEQHTRDLLGQIGASKIEMSTAPAPAHLNIQIDTEIYNVNWYIPHYDLILETRFDHGRLVNMNCWDNKKVKAGQYHHLQPHDRISRITFLKDGHSWRTKVLESVP